MEKVAKVLSISNQGDLNLQGQHRPGFVPAERQLSLAYITIPRLNRNGDEPGAFQARELLRKTLVGKQVSFSVAYANTNNQHEYGIVKLGEQNIACLLLQEGWAKMRDTGSKAGDSESKIFELYRQAEASAQNQHKGQWATDSPLITALYEPPSALESFVNQFKGKRIEAIIEQVRGGDSIRARLLLDARNHQLVTVLIAGIKCPAASRTLANDQKEAEEEFGDTAKSFVEARLLQRSVHVILLGTNQNKSAVIGTVSHPAGNIAEALLTSGLARVADHQSVLLGAESIGLLRTAELSAKQKKLNLWRAHVQNTMKKGEEDAIVSRIISADTVLIRTKENKERRIQIGSVRGPKTSDAKQALYVAEAKEFLRKKTIGKHVQLSNISKKPATDGYEERETATITVAKDDLAKLIVERGYANVIRHRRDDEDRSPIWDELVALEEIAIKEGKGMHSSKSPPAPGRIVDVSESATRAKQYLSTFQRAKRMNAIVDFVSSGGRFKLSVPRENAKLTFVLSGIQVPRTARNSTDAPEAFANEAAEYAHRKCMQRDVEIEVQSADRVGGLIGCLFVTKDNFAVGLLEEGLASIHEYSVEQTGHATLYRAAEDRAKAQKKGIWQNYIAEQASTTQATSDTPTKVEYLDVVISEANSSTGSLHIQTIGESVKTLEKLMQELQRTCATAQVLITPPKVGDQVAAKFSEDDTWYRARIKRVDRAAGKADVLYYDYGNSEAVAFKKLVPLPTSFSKLPAQAREIKLSFITLPEVPEYLEDAINYLQSITQMELVAAVDHREGIISVSLYDGNSSGDQSESINAKMVEEGWATVIASERMTWEKAHSSTIKALQIKQTEALRRRRGMFEFGEI